METQSTPKDVYIIYIYTAIVYNSYLRHIFTSILTCIFNMAQPQSGKLQLTSSPTALQIYSLS